MSTLTSEKANFISVLTGVFGDLNESKTAAQKAQEIADALEVWIKKATVGVEIPIGAVIIAVAPPGVGTPNPAPIPLSGNPDGPPGMLGGIT